MIPWGTSRVMIPQVRKILLVLHVIPNWIRTCNTKSIFLTWGIILTRLVTHGNIVSVPTGYRLSHFVVSVSHLHDTKTPDLKYIIRALVSVSRCNDVLMLHVTVLSGKRVLLALSWQHGYMVTWVHHYKLTVNHGDEVGVNPPIDVGMKIWCAYASFTCFTWAKEA